MHQRWKQWLTRALVGSLTVPTGLVASLVTAPAVYAAESDSDIVVNEVVSNSTTEYVELYNKGVDAVSLSGWTLTDASGTSIGASLSGTLTAGAFLTRTSTGLLSDTGDSVILKNSSGAVIDSIEYGVAPTAKVPAPDANKNVERASNGSATWLSNVTASRGVSDAGAANITPTVQPPVPTATAVKAGTSNSANTVNSASKSATIVDVTLPTTTDTIGKVDVLVFDTAITAVEGSKTGASLSGTVSTDAFSTSTLNDGALTLRSYSEDTTLVRSAWFSSSTATTKDTAAPSPVVSSPTSATTIHASSVTVTGTTEASSTVKAYLDADNNGVADSASAVATGTTTGTSFSIAIPLTANSANNFVLTATDPAGNETTTAVDVPTITEDSTAPATVTVNSFSTNSTGKVTISWTASTSTDVLEYRIFTDNATGTLNFTSALSSVASPATTFTSDVLADGTYQFVIRVADLNGNVTTNTNAISITVDGPKLQSSATAPGATADLVSAVGLSFTPATGTSGASTFTVTNLGTTLPAGSVPSGIGFLGQFFDVADSVTPSSANPVLVKYYYTTAQLAAAGISEHQLQGIYSYDAASGSWKLYTNTGVDTTDGTINGVAYAGFVYANADHFTPIAVGADTVAPTKPANLTATPGDTKVSLTWDSVSDATSYQVRWPPATSKDTVAYTTLTVSGGSSTTATATGLNNGWEYELGVAAIDAVGNVGQFAVVVATPRATVVTTASASTATLIATTPVVSSSRTVGAPSGQSSTEPESPTASPSSGENAQVGSGAATSTDATGNRALVIALILVIAAGAGAAGYYGYQWWAERPAGGPNGGTPPTPEEPKTPASPGNGRKKGKSNSGRW